MSRPAEDPPLHAIEHTSDGRYLLRALADDNEVGTFDTREEAVEAGWARVPGWKPEPEEDPAS